MKNTEASGNDNPISEMIFDALKNVKTYMDMDTLIGSPLNMGDDINAYPIIKITVGVVAGGGQYANKSLIKRGKVFPYAGGSSVGMSAEPVGFLIVNKGEHSLITIQNENAFYSVIEKVGGGLSSYLKNLGKNLKNNKKE